MQSCINRKRACIPGTWRSVHFHPSLSPRPSFRFFQGSGSETTYTQAVCPRFFLAAVGKNWEEVLGAMLLYLLY